VAGSSKTEWERAVSAGRIKAQDFGWFVKRKCAAFLGRQLFHVEFFSLKPAFTSLPHGEWRPPTWVLVINVGHGLR
jgi:hypothetical protein